ncbi:MAG: hypothetical protein GY730_00630 [bacterium]|nr:hypothetical protein [bacterium]
MKKSFLKNTENTVNPFKKRGLYTAVVLCFYFIITCQASGLFSQEKVKLSADHIYCQEDTHNLIASSNVRLIYGDIEVQAQKLCLDTASNHVWGTGNIRIRRGDDEFYSSYLYFDLNEEVVKLKDINIKVVPAEKNEKPLFLSASKLDDTGKMKSGSNGFFTSCSHKSRHYFVWAQYFEYYPDQRLIGYNVFIYNPVLFVPFAFWTPVYFYELGKRRIVWRNPTIGEKKTAGWGWFMQNTIDYDNIDGEDSSLYLDFFEFKKSRIEGNTIIEETNWRPGLGIKHQYKLFDNRGQMYFYQLVPYHNEIPNIKRNWEQSWQFDNNLSLDLKYTNIDAELINSSGRKKVEESVFNVKYDNLGDKYDLSAYSKEDFRQNYKKNSLKLTRSFNGDDLYSFNLVKEDYASSKRKNIRSTLKQSVFLPDDIKMSNDLDFNKEQTASGINDYRLDTSTIFSREIWNNLNVNLVIDHTFDLEAKERSKYDSKNDYLFKQPEFNINYNDKLFAGISLTEKITIARYQEVQYDNGTGKARFFPEPEDFGVEPNTYIFKQSLNKRFSDLPADSSLFLSASYDQYIFKNAGYSLFEGDALYKYNFKVDHTMDLGFFKTSTIFNRGFSPNDEENNNNRSNSPFFRFDSEKRSDTDSFTEVITFYWDSESKYKWQHTGGYNLLTGERNDHSVTLLINPNKIFKFNMTYGINFNGSGFEGAKHKPRIIDIQLAPLENLEFSFNIFHNDNFRNDKGELASIRDSSLKVNFNFGGDQDNRWEIEAYYQYMNYNGQMQTIRANRYELQNYSIIKNDHCRRFQFTYDMNREEIRFKVTVLAFPEDSIGYVKNKEISKIEGVLDDASAERF